jgi:hypothetical protein
MCTIETADALGSMVNYVIEARPNQMVHIRLCWRGKNNLVYRDPLTASKKVKGTLSSMETEFPLPPVKRFAPAYRLHVTFKRSLSSKLASTMSCKDVRRKQGVAETILIEDPLHTEAVVPISMPRFSISDEVFDLDAACEEMLLIKMSSTGSLGSFPDVSSPCSAHSFHSVHSLHRPSSGSFGPGSTLGQLRVRELHASGVQWPFATDASRVMCCRLSFGITEERTCTVPYNANPTWDEVLDFPVLAGELHGDVKLELLGIVNGQELFLGRSRVPASTVLISSNGNNRALVSERLEGEGMCPNACMNMELLFLADAAGCGEEACASDGEESDCCVIIKSI